MKDWRKVFETGSPAISYDPDALLEDIKRGFDPDEDEVTQDDFELIRKDLQALADSGVITVQFEEPEFERGEAAAGGEELLWLVLAGAGTFFAAYPGAKEFGADVRDKLPELAAAFKRIVKRLRSSGRNRWISIGQKGAILSAWAWALEQGRDVALEYVSTIERPTEDGYNYPVGWLLTFTIDGSPFSAIVRNDGDLIPNVAAPDSALIVTLANEEKVPA